MNTALTDILVCPVCDPESMLVLLAERVENRRVLEGVLGCPQCGQRYPVSGGEADLRPRPGAEQVAAGGVVAEPDQDSVIRLAALLGLARPGGVVLLGGEATSLAGGLAAVVEVEVVTVDAATTGGVEPGRVSRIAAGNRLPFHGASLRAVGLAGDAALEWLEDAARVLAPGGRLVVEGAADEAAARVEAVGLRILAREGGTLVAER